MNVDVSKVVVIKLDKDYGGSRAWTIQENYYDENSHKVLKREHFSKLQEAIELYLSYGFKVEIENQEK